METYFLHLELDCAFHLLYFIRHLLSVTDDSWKFACFVQTWSQDSRNHLDDSI